MPMYKDGRVTVEGCTVLWDAMNKPDANESGTKHSFKVAVPPHSPDVALLEQLANQCLQESDFKGVMPANGRMPLGTLGPGEYEGKFNGWRVFTAGTYRGVPDVYIDGQAVDWMQAAPLTYPGQLVDVLVHCYANNGKVKGIACGLDAFNIQASKGAQRANFGGGGIDTAGAFGGGSAAPAAPPQQSTGYLPPPPAPAAPPAEVKYSYNGAAYTADQLRASGWGDAQIEALPRA